MSEQIGPRIALEGSGHGVYSEPTPRRIRAVLAGETIVDSTLAQLVWEHVYYPQYYLPMADVGPDVLRPSTATGSHDKLGQGRYFDVTAGGETRAAGAWQYPEAEPALLRDHVRFDWNAADTWYEEAQEVIVHPRSPYVRIDTLPSTRQVRIEVDGVQVAASERPTLLYETGLPTRYYLPPDDVAMELLTPTDTVTKCPYKGVARYWSITVGGRLLTDTVWCYEQPFPESTGIAGLLSFYPDRVDIAVDGERIPAR